MSENLDSNEFGQEGLSNISLEQGKILVRRIEDCIRENSSADLFVFLDFGAAPFEVIMRELNQDPNLDIQHLRIDRNLVRKLGKPPIKDLQIKVGKLNIEFLKTITENKKHIVLIDDIEYEGGTLALAEMIIKSVNPKCNVVKFPIIKSTQTTFPGSDAWPFALFDDVGMVNGYRMPWETDQDKLVGRKVDERISMRTVSVDNPDRRAISLTRDLQMVSKYFKGK